MKLLELLKYETKRYILKKYTLVLLILIAYFLITIFTMGLKNGLLVTIVTWSFFLFCTPLPDAGILLSLPIRLVSKIKMVYSQIGVFVIGILINLFVLLLYPKIYSRTILLSLFHEIIFNPWPYWIIIILSVFGTLLSLYFGDELMDVNYHKDRKKYHKHLALYQYISYSAIIILTIIIYFFLINNLGVKIPLF